jgi:DnaJ homolog subfamily C member 7
VFGSGAAGAPEMRRSFSSGSGEALLTDLSAAIDDLVLDDGSGRRSDADAPGGDDPAPVTNASGPFWTRGSNSSLHEGLFPDSIHDQTEKLDEGSRAPSETIQCDSAEAASLASPTCSDHDAPIEFARFGDSLPVRKSVDEGSLPEDGSKIPAHGVNVQQDVFVFGGHAGYRDLTANATQTSISKVDSADKDGVTYNSGQLNASVAKDSTCTKFILQDAKHAFGSTNKNPLHSEPCEISSTAKFASSFGSEDGGAKVSFINVSYDIKAVEASELNECRSFGEKSFTAQDHNVASKNKGGVKGVIKNRRTVMPKKFPSAHQVSSSESVPRRSDNCSGKASLEENVKLKEASSFALSDSGINCARGNSYNSASQITDSSHGGTEFTSSANMEHSGQSDFIFSASTFNQSTLHLQRRHSKKKSGGMCNHANSIQSLPSSAVGPARSEVSASQQCADSAARWTEYSKMEPNRVTTCTKTENFEHHEDCETWRLRCLHDLLLSLPFAYLVTMDHKGEITQPKPCKWQKKTLQNQFEVKGLPGHRVWGR